MPKSGDIKGMKQLLNKLIKLGPEGVKRVAQTTEVSAREIEASAKLYARSGPFDFGTLAGNIKAIEQNKLNWKVLANAFGTAPYSAYQEFGTGGLVEVPQELSDIAIKFKGKGVKQINLSPQPFLYPAFVKGRKQYIDDLENDLEDLTKNI